MDPIEGATSAERVLIQRAAEKNIPINGSIELLPVCNMNCDMCYVRLDRHSVEQKGGLHTAEDWMRIADQMRDAGTLFLLLTGGEPLLYPGFRELYLYLRQMGMILTLNTNATLLDEEWADFFGKHKPRRINITLYGKDGRGYRELCHYPGGFEKVIRAVRLLRERDVDVKLGFSVARALEKDVPAMMDIARSLDVPDSVDTYMLPATRERDLPYNEQARMDPEMAADVRMRSLRREAENDREFADYCRQQVWISEQIAKEVREGKRKREERPMSCLAGRCSYSLNWQGEMHPCVILTEPSANVFETGFSKGWDIVSRGCRQISLCADCSVCKYQSVCRTCAASHLLEGGGYDRKPPYMCAYAKASLRWMQNYLDGKSR